MRVLLVSKLPPPRGGIATWTELVVAQARQDKDVDLHLVDINPRWRRVDQIEVWRRCVGGGMQLLRDMRRVRKALRQTRPAVLHLCTSGHLSFLRDVVLLRAAASFDVRGVLHLRFGRVPELLKSTTWEKSLAGCAMRLADTVVAIDERTRVSVQAMFPEKRVRKVPNCVEPENVRPLPGHLQSGREPGRLRVAYIGWIIRTKGVLELVEAARRVAGEMAFELELIGPSEAAYLAEIRRTGAALGKSLLIRGELNHVQAMQALEQADVCVLPSYSEGFPNVVMEAMALGKPVIGTDVGAIPEMLGAERGAACGLVVPPRDVDALAGALRTLLGDQSLRERLGRAGEAKVRAEYSVQVVFGQLKALWLAQATEGRTQPQ